VASQELCKSIACFSSQQIAGREARPQASSRALLFGTYKDCVSHSRVYEIESTMEELFKGTELTQQGLLMNLRCQTHSPHDLATSNRASSFAIAITITITHWHATCVYTSRCVHMRVCTYVCECAPTASIFNTIISTAAGEVHTYCR
jgi:hypothetical protein